MTADEKSEVMKISMISFTQAGCALAERLGEYFTGRQDEARIYVKSKYAEQTTALPVEEPLREWTKEHWRTADALIFVGATGIAVRAIAPFVQDKTQDPAVICMDEQGKFCISLLSGHLGGANGLAEAISREIGSAPVITTATDLNNCFAIDLFADSRGIPIRASHETGLTDQEAESCAQQDTTVMDTVWAKEISAALLAGKKIVTAGIGCRKGVPFVRLEQALLEACEKTRISINNIGKIASIDLKKEEPGLLELAGKYRLPFLTYTAEELRQVSENRKVSDHGKHGAGQSKNPAAQEKQDGPAQTYTASAFVESVTGVDNVCERSAVLASGNGILIQKKIAGDRVTVALAIGREVEDHE